MIQWHPISKIDVIKHQIFCNQSTSVTIHNLMLHLICMIRNDNHGETYVWLKEKYAIAALIYASIMHQSNLLITSC